MARGARLIAAASVIAMVLGLSAAAAEEPVAGIETLNATVTSASIAVTGKATLAGHTDVVGTDEAGDNVLPGTDLLSASITPVSGTQLRFDLRVGDLPEPTGGTPEAVNYWWEFNVVRAGTTSEFALQAWRASTAADLTCGVIFACPAGEPGEPRFQLSTCTVNETTGQRSCSAQSVAGSLDGDVFSWRVPASLINASGGAVITPVLNAQGNPVPIAASHGVSGISWNSGGSPVATAGGNTVRLGDIMAWSAWTFSAPTVHLGVAPADTPDEDVPTETPVTSLTLSNGNFGGTLPRPAQAGDYKVVATACFGAGNCGSASRVVTVE